jgi:hypothetical protein
MEAPVIRLKTEDASPSTEPGLMGGGLMLNTRIGVLSKQVKKYPALHRAGSVIFLASVTFRKLNE